MTLFRIAAVAIGVLAFSGVSEATIINLGVISLDTLIPAGSASGVNVFTINNFTGDPASGGFALPPDFPVLTDVAFLNARLTVYTATSSMVINLGNLGPGSYTPIELQFTDSLSFTSAVFAATLNPATLLLSDGTTFIPGSLLISATLNPAAGTTLQPGIDFSLVTASDVAAPEPSTWTLLTVGFLLYRPWKRRFVS
jgi:hypothetical protein